MCINECVIFSIDICEKCFFRFEKGYKRVFALGSPKTYCSRCGSLWLVVTRCGSLWFVVSRCDLLQLVVAGCIMYLCNIIMPSEDTKILENLKYKKSAKAPFIFYTDLQSLIKKIDGSKNNPEN